MNDTQINQALRRGEQARFRDGIIELVAGLASILLGLYFLVMLAAGDSLPGQLLAAFFALLAIAGWMGMRKLTGWLKARVSAPRSGYVEYPAHKTGALRVLGAILAAAVVSGGMVLFELRASITWNLMPAVYGLTLAALFGYLALRSRLPRLAVLTLAGLLLGGLFAALPMGDFQALIAFCAAFGLIALLSGGLAMRAYLRANPMPMDGSHGE